MHFGYVVSAGWEGSSTWEALAVSWASRAGKDGREQVGESWEVDRHSVDATALTSPTPDVWCLVHVANVTGA